MPQSLHRSDAKHRWLGYAWAWGAGVIGVGVGAGGTGVGGTWLDPACCPPAALELGGSASQGGKWEPEP